MKLSSLITDDKSLFCPGVSQKPHVLGNNESGRGCPGGPKTLKDTTISSVFVGIPPYIIKLPGDLDFISCINSYIFYPQTSGRHNQLPCSAWAVASCSSGQARRSGYNESRKTHIQSSFKSFGNWLHASTIQLPELLKQPWICVFLLSLYPYLLA